MQTTINSVTDIVSKSLTTRRIINSIVTFGTCIVVAIGIALIIIGFVIGGDSAVLTWGLAGAGIAVAVIGCCVSAVVGFIIGIYEYQNTALKAAKKFLTRESIKKYDDILDFQVEKLTDNYTEFRTRTVPDPEHSHIDPNDPSKSVIRTKQEKYLATINYDLYYIHITLRFPPKPEEISQTDFFKPIPSMTRVRQDTVNPTTNITVNPIPQNTNFNNGMMMNPNEMSNGMNTMGNNGMNMMNNNGMNMMENGMGMNNGMMMDNGMNNVSYNQNVTNNMNLMGN